MNIVDVLKASQNGEAIANLGRPFGLSQAETEAVVRAVFPKLSEGIERNTLSRGGLADLVNALGQGHDAILDQPSAIGDDAVRDDGNAILGHILGSKDRSRAVAEKAALTSGVSEGIIKMMLPFIASLLMGALSKQFKGGIGDILGRMGGAAQNGGSARMPELPRMPEMPRMPQGGSLPPSPLPLPGDVPGLPDGGNNPYGDLSDILRRGGRTSADAPIPLPGGASGGGALWSIVRGLIGGILGFQSKGVMGWILRVVVARYGFAILRAIFGRIFR